MSQSGGDEPIRDAVRNALRELMPEPLQQVSGQARNGHSRTASSVNGDPIPDAVPLVPAPPVAAVLRPSTWRGPAVPGEIVGYGAGMPTSDPAPATPEPVQPPPPSPEPSRPAGVVPPPQLRGPAARPAPLGGTVETVRIDGDEDLQAFVRSLVTRLESPRDRLAIKAGRLRFQLQRPPAPAGAPASDATPVVHLSKGAVTERNVREAHTSGARLLLSRAAVLTPLARDTARSLGVQIERESQC